MFFLKSLYLFKSAANSQSKTPTVFIYLLQLLSLLLNLNFNQIMFRLKPYLLL